MFYVLQNLPNTLRHIGQMLWDHRPWRPADYFNNSNYQREHNPFAQGIVRILHYRFLYLRLLSQ